MLILRRKAGERIIIAGDIIVSILKVQGDRVNIGIVAPPEINIARGELLKASSQGEERIPS